MSLYLGFPLLSMQGASVGQFFLGLCRVWLILRWLIFYAFCMGLLRLNTMRSVLMLCFGKKEKKKIG